MSIPLQSIIVLVIATHVIGNGLNRPTIPKPIVETTTLTAPTWSRLLFWLMSTRNYDAWIPT